MVGLVGIAVLHFKLQHKGASATPTSTKVGVSRSRKNEGRVENPTYRVRGVCGLDSLALE